MRYIEKYLTKFNLSAINIGICIIAMILLIIFTSVLRSGANSLSTFEMDDMLSMLMSASSLLKAANFLFILLLIASLISLIGSIFRYAYKREKCLCYVIYILAGIVAIYSSAKVLSFASGINDLLSAVEGSSTSMFGFGASLMALGSDVPVLTEAALPLYGIIKYALLGLILTGIYAGYCIYSSKRRPTTYEMLFGTSDAFPLEGTDVINAVKAATETTAVTSTAFREKARESSVSISEKVKNLTKKQKLTILGVAAAAVILIGGVTIYNTFFNFEELDLIANVQPPTFSGYNGEGIVENAPSKGDIDYDITDENMEAFLDDITYTLDKTESLSNGDEVTITAVYSEETAKALKIKVTEDTMTVKVSGLIERYAEGNSIPKEEVEAVAKVMDQRAEECAQSSLHFYGDDPEVQRLDLAFARQKEADYSGHYKDRILGVYKAYTEESLCCFIIATSDEVNEITDFEAMEYFESSMYDHYVYALETYLSEDSNYVLTSIGDTEEKPDTLQGQQSGSDR